MFYPPIYNLLFQAVFSSLTYAYLDCSSSDGVVTILGAGMSEESWFDFRQRIEISSLVQIVQIRSGANSAFYRKFSGNCFF
jgi:hypothetical protein